jgi:hypothetical protein
LNRTHKIALDPTVCQEAYFRRCCGVARFTFNWALAEWKKQYVAGKKPSGVALKKQFNAIRHVDFPWTGDVLRDATAQPFVNVQRAYQNFFEKRGKYPRFKKKGIHDSFYVANDKFSIDGNRIQILGIRKFFQELESRDFMINGMQTVSEMRWTRTRVSAVDADVRTGVVVVETWTARDLTGTFPVDFDIVLTVGGQLAGHTQVVLPWDCRDGEWAGRDEWLADALRMYMRAHPEWKKYESAPMAEGTRAIDCTDE